MSLADGRRAHFRAQPVTLSLRKRLNFGTGSGGSVTHIYTDPYKTDTGFGAIPGTYFFEAGISDRGV